MKPLTQKQIKIGWIVAAILVTVHFAPGMIQSAIRGVANRKPPAARPVIAPAVQPQSPPSAPTGPALPLEVQQRFLGVWDGTQNGQ